VVIVIAVMALDSPVGALDLPGQDEQAKLGSVIGPKSYRLSFGSSVIRAREAVVKKGMKIQVSCAEGRRHIRLGEAIDANAVDECGVWLVGGEMPRGARSVAIEEAGDRTPHAVLFGSYGWMAVLPISESPTLIATFEMRDGSYETETFDITELLPSGGISYAPLVDQ
jgi:hypothetical protein